MKKWKKLVSLLLCVVMTMALLAACGSSDEAPSTTAAPAADPAPTEAAPAETEAAADPASYGDDVAAIVDRGVLRVGVKNAVVGFGFQDVLTQEYSGMEITLAEMIADYLGVDVEFTTVTAATRTQLLDSGDIDCVLATFTITEERKLSWDFTTPYYTDYVTVLVEDSSGIETLADLVDKKVGVSSGSTSARSLVSAMIDEGVLPADGFDADTFDPATWTSGISFAQYDDYPTISTALTAGEVDAFCVDKSILAVYNTDGRHYVDAQFAPQEYGVATKLGSGMSALCEELISGWLADGTIAGLITENGIE